FKKSSSSIYNYIHRSEFNFISSTFFRPSGDASAIFRLSRCLYSMQMALLKCNRILSFRTSYFSSIFSNFCRLQEPPLAPSVECEAVLEPRDHGLQPRNLLQDHHSNSSRKMTLFHKKNTFG
ncbi:hypothetical protein L9F63_015045, partial [Diploptera punctata]